MFDIQTQLLMQVYISQLHGGYVKAFVSMGILKSWKVDAKKSDKKKSLYKNK